MDDNVKKYTGTKNGVITKWWWWWWWWCKPFSDIGTVRDALDRVCVLEYE